MQKKGNRLCIGKGTTTYSSLTHTITSKAFMQTSDTIYEEHCNDTYDKMQKNDPIPSACMNYDGRIRMISTILSFVAYS